jgi:nicotinamide phosphoribosyltransferase
MNKNILLKTDSYKYSHWLQYPPKTNTVFSYIESRGSDKDLFPNAVFYGLQIFLKEYLSKPFTLADIDQAEKFAKLHGEPFNREGFEYILDVHKGFFPVVIKAVPEGTVVPEKNVMVTVESTDPKCYWVASFVETMLLRAVWYPTTVATLSYYCRKKIQKYMDVSCDNLDGIVFKLHDFGGRGVSSSESAALGGSAHLVNFFGTDTVEGAVCANEFYDIEMSGFSIPAAEHSTITAWGKENEVEAYRNMLRNFAKPGSLVACVSDSYDIFKACELWGTVLKDEVINSGATIVIRPDSGDPAPTVLACLNILGELFGYTINKKGYKVLNYVRLIQGDGINYFSIGDILDLIVQAKWSVDNVAFGMGGGLLQQVNRDTLKFAMKCSAIDIDGEWFDVYKESVGKVSKKGRLSLYNYNGSLTTQKIESAKDVLNMDDVLQVVYENGILYNLTTFAEVRKRAWG